MEFSAGGLVFKKNGDQYQFVLIQDSNNQWTFPKGHIEKPEKPEETALRETSEEIGLKSIRVIELIEKSDYWFKFNEELIHKFVYFYLIENFETEDLIVQTEEINAASWFSPEEAIKIVGYKKQNLGILLSGCKKLGISCKEDVNTIK